MKGILHKYDPLDIDDFLIKVEKSYQINMIDSEMKIETFGEFIDYVLSKLKLKNSLEKKECSSQYIFYNLRKTISENDFFSSQNIFPKTKLNSIFPISKRKKQIQLLEQKLGFKINALQPPTIHSYLTVISIVLTLISITTNLFSSTFMWYGILISLIFIFTSKPLTLIFKDQTIGDLIKRIERENYISSQKNINEYNEKEVEKNITELFKDYFYLQNIEINRETKL